MEGRSGTNCQASQARQASESGSAEMAEAPMVRDIAWPEAEEGVATHSQAEYRTLPRKISPALVAAGGAFALIGAFGAWIRMVQITGTGEGSQQVGSVWGYSEPTGRAIAILAAVTVFIAAVTYFTTHL